MTDNCSTMHGSRAGFVTKLREYCPSLVKIPGSSGHQANLLQRGSLKCPDSDMFAKINIFLATLSNTVHKTSEIHSTMRQAAYFLGLP